MLTNKKIAAFDLDGTLSESKLLLGDEMAQLLAKLATTTKVVVISGASFKQFSDHQFLPAWQGPFTNLILLPVNGSQRFEYDLNEQKWVMTDSVPFEDNIKNKIMGALDTLIESGQHDIPLAKDAYGPFVEDRGTQITFAGLGQDAPIELKKRWDPDQAKRIKIKTELEPLIPEADIVIGGTTSIDILPKGFDKAAGLTRLLKKLSFTKEEMIFVGDSVFPGGNDYSPKMAGIETIAIKDTEETANLIKSWLQDTDDGK